jgi:DNA-binding GntR family transcriptional regulator
VIPTIQKSAAPLRQQVIEQIRQSIISGDIPPGARLIERELVSGTGVSRTVIREALRHLESEGLVKTMPNKGPVVRELTKEEARDLYAIRGVLEGLAGRLFVERGTRQHLAQLRQALEDTEAAYRGGDPQAVLASKNEFYHVLFAGTGSETITAMMDTLYARISRWRALGLAHPQRSPGRSTESIDGMRKLLDAIEARDAELAEKLSRDEAAKAGAEVMRLLSDEQTA